MKNIDFGSIGVCASRCQHVKNVRIFVFLFMFGRDGVNFETEAMIKFE